MKFWKFLLIGFCTFLLWGLVPASIGCFLFESRAWGVIFLILTLFLFWAWYDTLNLEFDLVEKPNPALGTLELFDEHDALICVYKEVTRPKVLADRLEVWGANGRVYSQLLNNVEVYSWTPSPTND